MNHAFAAAVAPSDAFDETRVREALKILGQDADEELICVYCGAKAETWDHVFAIVKNSAFSGYGHRIGNLLPCCKPCNSQKGNKHWRDFMAQMKAQMKMTEIQRIERERQIGTYIEKYGAKDIIPEDLTEYQELRKILQQVLCLFKKADKLATDVRNRSNKAGVADKDIAPIKQLLDDSHSPGIPLVEPNSMTPKSINGSMHAGSLLEQIKAIKKHSHQSWSNLRKGCLDPMGVSVHHGTPNVRAFFTDFRQKGF